MFVDNPIKSSELKKVEKKLGKFPENTGITKDTVQLKVFTIKDY